MTPPPDPRALSRMALNLFAAPLQPAIAALPGAFGLGRPIGELSAASQTPVVPEGYAFAIWGPIFALSIAWAVWQALPANRDSEAARRLGWPLGLAALFNCLWMLVATFTDNGFHLVAIIAGCAGFALAAAWGARDLAGGLLVRWVVVPLAMVQAGWLSAAFFVNLAGAQKMRGVSWLGLDETSGAMVVILIAGCLAAGIARLLRENLFYAGAVVWALVAVIVANLGGNQFNLPVAISAAGMAALIGWTVRGRVLG
jgi:hypothetical protein